jgi:hypothetical protein
METFPARGLGWLFAGMLLLLNLIGLLFCNANPM